MIIDASVGAKWLIPEFDRGLALDLLARLDLAAPDLLKLEVGHLLGKRLRRGDMPAQFTRDAWAELRELPVQFRPTGEFLDRAFDLSCRLGAAIYDCVYLALAEAEDDMLVTADERFARAIRQGGDPALAGRVRLLSEFAPQDLDPSPASP